MITLEIIEQLTPERIKALSLEEKREALALLEALEIPRLERARQLWAKRPYAERAAAGNLVGTIHKQEGGFVYLAERIQAVRKRYDAMTPEQEATERAKRKREIDEWWAWKQEQIRKQAIAEGRNPDAETVAAVWRKMRETNPRAGGAGVDRLLGVPTPAEPLVALPADQEPTPKPIAVQKPLTAAEWAKAESERVQAEAAEFQRTDFLTQVCGVGFTHSTGPAKRRWDA